MASNPAPTVLAPRCIQPPKVPSHPGFPEGGCAAGPGGGGGASSGAVCAAAAALSATSVAAANLATPGKCLGRDALSRELIGIPVAPAISFRFSACIKESFTQPSLLSN